MCLLEDDYHGWANCWARRARTGSCICTSLGFRTCHCSTSGRKVEAPQFMAVSLSLCLRCSSWQGWKNFMRQYSDLAPGLHVDEPLAILNPEQIWVFPKIGVPLSYPKKNRTPFKGTPKVGVPLCEQNPHVSKTELRTSFSSRMPTCGRNSFCHTGRLRLTVGLRICSGTAI